MSTAEMALTNNYWCLLRNLSDGVKLRLASMLTNSVADNQEEVSSQNESLTEQMIAKYAGALDEERSADEIIADIRKNRSSKPIQEYSL